MNIVLRKSSCFYRLGDYRLLKENCATPSNLRSVHHFRSAVVICTFINL